MRLIQHGAHRWHLGVSKHRIPARLLGLEPMSDALAVLWSHRRREVIGKVTEPLAQRYNPQACALAAPVQQRMELRA